MSILDGNSVPEVVPAVVAADHIRRQCRITFAQLVSEFNTGSQRFWQHPTATPAEIAAALGTDAREAFELHGKIGALIASIRPAAIQSGMAVVGKFAVNEDGTVTVG
jgi:hypothetical protein